MQGVQNDAGSIGYSSDKNNSMVVVVQAEQGHPGDDCIQNCFKKHDADNIGTTKADFRPCSTDKSYSRDNRLIFPKSSHRWEGLAPRCRLFATWGCSMFQGLGCSPIKAVRELGSERRETVRSISGVGVRALRGPFPSTRGPGRTHLWCTSYRAHGKRWVAKCGADNY
ncbi:hypothetical protein V6N13_036577 [Hibiscus sabdariffa]